jgi:hypothetical protein
MRKLTWIATISRVVCFSTLRPFSQRAPQKPVATSHLSLVPFFLQQTLKCGDVVVDATAGNGHDSLILADIIKVGRGGGTLLSIDIQTKAIEATRQRLLTKFTEHDIETSVKFLHASHADWFTIDSALASSRGEAKAWVYNLGYLPGGDKTLITKSDETLLSIRGAGVRTSLGGIMCITCYPGHEGGDEEAKQVKDELQSWDPCQWRVCEFARINQIGNPVLYTAHKFEVCPVVI